MAVYLQWCLDPTASYLGPHGAGWRRASAPRQPRRASASGRRKEKELERQQKINAKIDEIKQAPAWALVLTALSSVITGCLKPRGFKQPGSQTVYIVAPTARVQQKPSCRGIWLVCGPPQKSLDLAAWLCQGVSIYSFRLLYSHTDTCKNG